MEAKKKEDEARVVLDAEKKALDATGEERRITQQLEIVSLEKQALTQQLSDSQDDDLESLDLQPPRTNAFCTTQMTPPACRLGLGSGFYVPSSDQEGDAAVTSRTRPIFSPDTDGAHVQLVEDSDTDDGRIDWSKQSLIATTNVIPALFSASAFRSSSALRSTYLGCVPKTSTAASTVTTRGFCDFDRIDPLPAATADTQKHRAEQGTSSPRARQFPSPSIAIRLCSTTDTAIYIPAPVAPERPDGWLYDDNVMRSSRQGPLNTRPPKSRVPRFDGNPRNWQNFIASFKTHVHDVCANDQERLTNLKSHPVPLLANNIGAALDIPGISDNAAWFATRLQQPARRRRIVLIRPAEDPAIQ